MMKHKWLIGCGLAMLSLMGCGQKEALYLNKEAPTTTKFIFYDAKSQQYVLSHSEQNQETPSTPTVPASSNDMEQDVNDY